MKIILYSSTHTMYGENEKEKNYYIIIQKRAFELILLLFLAMDIRASVSISNMIYYICLTETTLFFSLFYNFAEKNIYLSLLIYT